mmetsp:Transcript_2596/g.5288  ORF Transcript_2596/g.5288 Transcript_2596/m.5288 type:complete len:214 (+) Transcript_2596:499-1140(+)
MITGLHTLCEPKTNCQPRNQVYNIAIHILTGCFTWMVSVVYPWRCVHLLHSTGNSSPFRSNEVGLDFNGQPSDDVWFHVVPRKRIRVLLVLHANTLFQYANQITRAVFASHADAEELPGNVWTASFFALSFIMAGIGGSFYWKYTSDVRETDKERFGRGPIDTARELYKTHVKSVLLRKRQALNNKNKSLENRPSNNTAAESTPADGSQMEEV